MKIKNKISVKLLSAAVLSSILLFSNCKKEEDFLPVTSVNSEVNLNDSIEELSVTPVSVTSSSISSGAYKIEQALPNNYVKDGSVDYTTYIQTAINKYSEIVFPAFPLLVNDNGLKIPSNRKIYFLNGSELRLKPTSKGSYTILSMRNVSNVTIVSPLIKGDRTSHTGSTGEWGMGIGIRGSSNITITGAEIFDCWGDGIYIDNYDGKISKNITLSNVTVKSSRRAGISVISVDGLLIQNSYFGYTSGADPMAGINFEPDNSSAEFKNVKLKNIRTEYNQGVGIQVGISKLYGGISKFVSFDFENFMDKGSTTGLRASCSVSRRKGKETINGTIKLDTPFWRKNSLHALKTSLDKDNLRILISHPKVTLMDGTYLGAEAAKSELLKKGSINPLAQTNKLVIFQ